MLIEAKTTKCREEKEEPAHMGNTSDTCTGHTEQGERVIMNNRMELLPVQTAVHNCQFGATALAEGTHLLWILDEDPSRVFAEPFPVRPDGNHQYICTGGTWRNTDRWPGHHEVLCQK